jgi:hypothetical protein
LISLEVGYFFMSVMKYIKKKHLKSFRFLIPKAGQSLFLIVFESSLFYSVVLAGERELPLTVTK